MARPLRIAPGGFIYHVLNRANGRVNIFDKSADYLAFERILAEVQARLPMRILAWCLMPNHWHLVLWPTQDGSLSDFVRLLTVTHAQRWHAHRASIGTGHLYQGRFKSFVVQQDAHLLTLCRYVERNALRANLVRRAEEWRWCSLWRTHHDRTHEPPRLEPWPVPRPQDWIGYVNRPQTGVETNAVRRCIQRSAPYGEARWVRRTADLLGLECALRPRGRPRKGCTTEKGS
jgi:putative transposase